MSLMLADVYRAGRRRRRSDARRARPRARADPSAGNPLSGRTVRVVRGTETGLRFPVTRPYSIASPPSNRCAIELLFNLVPGGPGSTFLFSLQSGDPVSFRGPAGTFVLRDYPDRRLLFVATGTGIAPIRSMLHARLPSPYAGHTHLGTAERARRLLSGRARGTGRAIPGVLLCDHACRSRRRRGPARSAACSRTSNPTSRLLTISRSTSAGATR